MIDSLRCPACAKSMYTKQCQSLEYEQCDNCHGFWYNFSELKTALELDIDKSFGYNNIERGDDQHDHDHHYQCPECECEMEQREYAYDSGVHIDGCPQCKGVFVSEQDLAEIKRFLSSSKNSAEADELNMKALMAMHGASKSWQDRQARLAKDIDDSLWSDDLISPRIFDWLITEFTDVDSFPSVDQ